MYEVEVMDPATSKIFAKHFAGYPAAVRFYYRVVHSKKLVLRSCNFDPAR